MAPMTEPNPVGRPTDYKEEYADQAHRLALLGMTDEEMANFFQVAVSTFYLWKKNINEFSEAISNGKEKADADIAFGLYDRAKGAEWEEEQAFKIKVGPHLEKVEIVKVKRAAPPDTKAAIMWLKNRRKKDWRDTVDHTNDGSPFEAFTLGMGHELKPDADTV